MKNSKEYSGKIQKYYLSLKKKYPKPHKVSYDEPLDAVIYAFISQNIAENAAQAASKRFSEYFVDLNDLRVSRVEEIVEVLGVEGAVGKSIGLSLLSVLRAIFEKFNIVSFESLKKMSKRPARQLLEKFVVDNRFVVDYCMLTALRGHTIPLTGQMIEFLKTNSFVDAQASHEEIEGFLARQVSAQIAYEFYFLLRRGSEAGKLSPSRAAAKQAKQNPSKKA